MERCTDNRSTTPPLETMPIASKSKENGKQQFAPSLYDKEDQADISQSIPMSSSEDMLYISSTPPQPPSRASKSSVLCNYDSTSEEDGEVTESNSKSTLDRCESKKSSVINANNRKSEGRNQKNRRDRRRSRDSSSRRKSDRKQRRSLSRQRSKDYNNKRRRSRSKIRFDSSKHVPKELPKNREIRRTVTEPAIEYCENGRYSSSLQDRANFESKSKVCRTNDEDIDVISEQSANDTTEACSNPTGRKHEEPINECSPPCKILKTSNDDCFRSSTDDTKLNETKLSKQFESEDIFRCETDYLPSNSRESLITEQLPLNEQPSTVSEYDIRIPNKKNSPSHESSDNMDVTSTTPETPKTPPVENKKMIEPKLSEDKMKLYIDEYDNFIQQVSSPLNETSKTNEIDESIVITNDEPAKSAVLKQNESISNIDLPKNEVSSSTSSAQKIDKKTDEKPSTASSTSSSSDDDDSSTSTNSSSSSSSDDDDSSSSSSDSSSTSSSDNNSSNDKNSPRRNRRQRRKSSSKSSSRSASKSPRIRPSKACNIDVSKSPRMETDGLDFTVNDKNSYTNGIGALINPMTFVNGVDMSALKSLDALINGDDEDDLLRHIQSHKQNFLEQKKAKKQEAAKNAKYDETSWNDNSFNDSTLNYKNGALLHDTERKKISLKLKPTTTLKQQTKEVNESFLDSEQQSPIPTPTPPQPQPEQQMSQEQQQQSQTQSHKTVDIDKQTTNEHNDQIEKRSSDGSMTSSSKRKSSHRRDERKSRRSEDRKSRRSEDRGRSRRDENRRSRRSEERKNDKYPKRNEERRSRRSEERRSRHSEDRRLRRSEEKRSRRSEERRSKRRHDRSPTNSIHYRDSYYSPPYRNRSMSPLPRGPRTPPNTPPPNTTEFDEFRMDDMAMRQQMPPYGTSNMPPPAQYHPGQNQFPTTNLTPNVPSNFIQEYAAYMHPNRVPIQPQQHYNRPPPSINASALIQPPGMMSSSAIGPNNEYYYSAPPPPHLHLPNQLIPSNSYSNLIEVSPYGVPDSSNFDCVRKQQTENYRRKPTIAVQKGNVLEIVPSAEIHCDKNSDANNIEKSDKMFSIEKQALQRQKQDRFKRKMERHQKRLERTKRKEYLLNELARLSHCMTFANDGKVVKAGELLKGITFDGTTIKSVNSKDDDENEDFEDIYIEPPLHSYDPQAPIGRSILSERNDPDRIPTLKEKRRGVLFADGVAPGEGTSASEESANENDDNITKPKKLLSRDKKNVKNITMPPLINEPTSMFLEKENSFETKRDTALNEIAPPPPPGSPPPHLPQPKLKDPNKFIVNQLLYFQYDLRQNEMLITPTPHMMPMLKPPMVIIPPPIIQLPPLPLPLPLPPPPSTVQQMPTVQPPYPYKSNSNRHHSESKSSKSSRSSSSKQYHSSSSSSSSSLSHKHASSETNLIVLSSSPSNV